MKQTEIILLMSVFFALSCQKTDKKQTTAPQAGDTTSVEFNEMKYDFGTITQGEVIKHIFKFKNTGDKPLVIKDVHTSCGCTVADYSKEPVAPGDEGFISVTFDSFGKAGEQYKNVTIVMNTNPPKKILVITGKVKVENSQ